MCPFCKRDIKILTKVFTIQIALKLVPEEDK
jgi:hypothetical protein